MNEITNEDECIGILRTLLKDNTCSEYTKHICEMCIKDTRYLIGCLVVIEKLLAFHPTMMESMINQIILDRIANLINKNE